MVPRDGFEPPQSKTTDLQSAYLTNESLGLFGTGARIRTLTNSLGDCHATVTSHPYIKTKTTFVLRWVTTPPFVFSVNGDPNDRPNVDLVLISLCVSIAVGLEPTADRRQLGRRWPLHTIRTCYLPLLLCSHIN